MIEHVILTEHEKIVGDGILPNARSTSERLKEFEQLKPDGLVNEKGM